MPLLAYFCKHVNILISSWDPLVITTDESFHAANAPANLSRILDWTVTNHVLCRKAPICPAVQRHSEASRDSSPSHRKPHSGRSREHEQEDFRWLRAPERPLIIGIQEVPATSASELSKDKSKGLPRAKRSGVEGKAR